MRFDRALWAGTLLGALALAGCSHQTESPPATVGAEPRPVDPDVVCVEQVSTVVSLHGTGFTPMPTKTLEGTTQLIMPRVTLSRAAGLDGMPAAGQFVIPDDPSAPAASRVKWTSEQLMSAEVTPDQKIDTGLYDVVVTNPDGQASATFKGSLAAVPRPTLTKTTPDVLCDAEEDETVVLSGSGLLSFADMLPVVHIQGKDFAVSRVDGCVDVPGKHPTGKVQTCSSATFVIPKGAFAPGTYDVTLTNPATAGCVSTDKLALTIVPPPSALAVKADIVCDAQADQTMTVSGSDFLQLGAALPTVQIGTAQVTATSLSDCAELPGGPFAAGKIMTCKTLTLVIPKGALPEGDHNVVVTNPLPADCHSLEALTLHVTPPPTVAALEADVVCDAQGDQTITLKGTGLLQLGAALPNIKIGDVSLVPNAGGACTSIPGSFTEGAAAACNTLTFVLPKGSLAAGEHPVVVTNPTPADCHSVEVVNLHVAPPPTAVAVQADFVCDAQGDQTLTLKGTGLLQLGTALPTVKIGSVAVLASKADGCTTIPGPFAEGVAASCDTLTFVLPRGSLAAGDLAVVVTNPAPADCHSTEALTLHIAPPPTVVALAADLVCNAQGDQTLTLQGTGLLQFAGTLPSVKIGAVSVTPTAAGGCTNIAGQFSEGAVSACTSLTFVLPRGSLAPGDHVVVVTNPTPAACHSVEMVALHVAFPPTVTSLSDAAICDSQSSRTISLQGDHFLRVGSQLPAVIIGTQSFAPTAAGDCAPVVGSFIEGAVTECRTLTITIPQSTFVEGDFAVAVSNPAPANCRSTDAVTLHVEPPPEVTAAAPQTVCTGGTKITIDGRGFIANPAVTLTAAGKLPVVGTGTATNAGGTQLTSVVGAGAEVGVTYDLTVTNADSCVDAEPHKKVTVVSGPIVYFADPEVAYNGINTRVTIYATNLTLPLGPSAVSMVPAGQSTPVTPLPWTAVAGHPNRVQVVVPKGQTPGTYDLMLTDATSCAAFLPNALQVTSALTVSLKPVAPPFGWTQSETPITITRDKTVAAPANKPFVAIPRVFLNPTSPAAGDVAIPLRSVAFVDDATVTAIVPKGVPVHAYDLVMVNPDGSVGLLTGAFSVDALPPPTVDTVTPSSVVAASGQVVKASGRNFRGSTIALSCNDANGTALPAPAVTAVADVCDASQNCTQQATINASALAAGSVCVLRLSNADMSYVDYSAIGVSNSSLNLSNPKAGTNMVAARRALSAASADATSAARFVYAIGGDSGSTLAASPLASVEFAPVDLFGNMGAWKVAPYALAAGRSFTASTKMGRYIYLMGGSDGASAVKTAHRAMVLNPSEAPSLDVSDLVPATAGLAPGYWYYRVAATFDATDADNPLGESLPSDEFVVKVPVFAGKKIQIALTWTAPLDVLGTPLGHVSGYRVYRTTAVNGASGGEVLLTTVSASTLGFTDDGSLTPGSAVPVALGSTGQWATLPALATARKGAAAATAFDPSDRTKFYVYTLMGLDATNVALGSYEFLSFRINPNGHQTLISGTWTAGAQTSTAPRWQLGAWTADTSVAAQINATDTFVYLGGGLAANAAAVRRVEAGKITVGGDLGALSDTPADFSGTIAGYGVCAANGQLFAFGGQQAVPSSGAKSAKISTPPPALDNGAWNSEGLNMQQSRYLLGSSVQSAFIFLVGGQTATSQASNTTELVIW